MKKNYSIYKICTSLILVCLLLSCKIVRAASEYGNVVANNSEYTVLVNHDSLSNQEISVMAYNVKGDIDNVETDYIGYMNQGCADSDGTLTFTDVSINMPGTYYVYIGAKTLENKELLGSVIVTEPDVEEQMLGDMNGDKRITAIDALYALQNLDTISPEIADVNGDGNVDVKDVLEILQVASGNKTKFSK